MGTLLMEAKRNKERVSNIANQIVISANKAHATKILLTWHNNNLYCNLSGKKERREFQYSDIGRKTFNVMLQRLKEIGFSVKKTETLELNAIRFVLKK